MKKLCMKIYMYFGMSLKDRYTCKYWLDTNSYSKLSEIDSYFKILRQILFEQTQTRQHFEREAWHRDMV